MNAPWTETELVAALGRFGLSALRPLQEAAVAHALGGGDTLVLLPTGGGKSLCYQLPAVLRGRVVVVISPLLALMQDQVQALLARGIRVEMLCSLVTSADKTRIHRRLLAQAETTTPRAADTEPIELLYTTPETLGTDHVRHTLGALHRGGQLGLFAIDEAHCISTWGHDFRPAYLRLHALREDFPGVPLMALTATATARVREDIRRDLGMHPGALELIGDFNRPNISYTVFPKDGPHPRMVRALYDFIRRCHPTNAGIVYVHRRLDTEALARDLEGLRQNNDDKTGAATQHEDDRDPGPLGFAPYHAELPVAQRKRTLVDWLAGRVRVICATIAFGMGIDHPAVRFVVHWNLPQSMESLYQETGRAGRDGHPSHAVLFYADGEFAFFERLLRKAEQDHHAQQQRQQQQQQQQPPVSTITSERRARAAIKRLQYLQKKVELLRKVREWAAQPTTTPHCRRAALLAYFGQTFPASDCHGTCDGCSSAWAFAALLPITVDVVASEVASPPLLPLSLPSPPPLPKMEMKMPSFQLLPIATLPPPLGTVPDDDGARPGPEVICISDSDSDGEAAELQRVLAELQRVPKRRRRSDSVDVIDLIESD